VSPFPPPPDPASAPPPDEEIRQLLEGNRRWAEARRREDPETFPLLARSHRPPFLLVGCCDARKPMDLLTGAAPGHLFLHRNVANQVRPDDPAILASLEFAIGTLGVRHLIVCGHTGCGGMAAALADEPGPAVRGWTAPVRALAREMADELAGIESMAERADLLAERNVIRQLEHALEIDTVRGALGDPDRVFELHGWLFRLDTGRIATLDLPWARWRVEGRMP
jgi:carbonic anhydrase